MVSQIELIAAIGRELKRQKHDELNTRQMNAVIEAANLIIKEIETPHRESRPASGLAEWLASDDTGLSSRAMARHLAPMAGLGTPVPSEGGHWDNVQHPVDPSDFGRCYRLLEAVPELRLHLPRMAAVSPFWAALLASWHELERLYVKEYPTGRAPKLFDRMQAIIAEVRRGPESAGQ